MITVTLVGRTEKEADDLLPYVFYLEDEVGSLYIRTGDYIYKSKLVIVTANTVFCKN